MRLEWIEDILAIHDTGSLRAAAETRFLTSSAFTRRIRTVETAIGTELIDRNNKPVTLRPHVIELIPMLREASANLRNLKNELNDLGEKERSTRLICQHTLTVSWAPKVARKLAKSNSQLRIRSGSKDECAWSILKNDADIALVYEETDVNTKPEDDLFQRLHLGQEEFIPVAALNRNEDLKHLLDQKIIPLVTYPRNLFLGEVLDKTLSKKTDDQYRFATFAEAGLGPAVMEFVREGLGVGWLPRSLICEPLANGELTTMTDHLPSFSLNIVAISAQSAKTNFRKKVWEIIEREFGTLQ